MRVGNRVLVSLGAAALIASAVSAASPSHAKAAPNPITFSTPNVMSPQESVGEPTIVHSPASDNTVYASGPWGTGTQRSIWNASTNGGETFRLVQQRAHDPGEVAEASAAPTTVQGTPNRKGRGDSDQRLDPP